MTYQMARRAGRNVSLGLLAFSAMASAVQAQTTWRGFEGTAQLDNFFLDGAFRPPDTMGAVGTTQYLETTNGSVTVYDKVTGSVLSRVGANAFWQAAGATGSAGDQRVLFDMYSNRWIVNGFCAGVNEVCIAVSDTSDALGTWKSTKISTPTTNIADYPTLAVTQGAVIIGTNNFSSSGSFTGNSLYTIPKADLLGGAPTLANMTTFTTPVASADRGFSIQGATNWTGASATSANIFTVSRDQFDVLAYRLNGVNAAGATQTAVVDLNRTGYTFNNPGRQPDALPGGAANRLVDTLDDRVSGSVYEANGRIYGIHTVTPTGVPTASAYTELRYYVLDSATLAPISQGTISGGNYDYYQGSLAVNSFGDVVIGYNRSGAQTADGDGDGKADGRITFLARVMKDSGSGTLSQVGSDLKLRVSDVGDYRCGAQTTVDTSCRQRWGDYAAVTLDPSNPYSFWAIGEYADDWANFSTTGTLIRANWHTYIAEITVVPEPGTYGLMALGLAVVGMAARRRPCAQVRA